MKLSELKQDKGIIFKYVGAGTGGLALGASIGIVVSIIYLIVFRDSTLYPFFWITIPSIFGLGGAFFGIVLRDLRRVVHYGIVGLVLGLLMAYYVVGSDFHYYQPILIMAVLGFAVGLPDIKSAGASGIVGLIGGLVISTAILMIDNLHLESDRLFTLFPMFFFIFFFLVGSIMGFIIYTAEKNKKMGASFSNDYIIAGFIFGVTGVFIVCTVLMVIAAFMVATSQTDVRIQYNIVINSDNNEPYEIQVPFLTNKFNQNEIFNDASLTGNGVYSVKETTWGEAVSIKGSGDITFKVEHKFNELNENMDGYGDFIYDTEPEQYIYFEGVNGSVTISMGGEIGNFAGESRRFSVRTTTLNEGWQEISIGNDLLYRD